ncbi:MAG: 50S ribosomal protein L9 [bacterium]
MKVILRENVENVGSAGDVVDVKRGYAKNYLIPRNLAFAASKANLKALEKRKQLLEDKAEKRLREKRRIAERIESTSITLSLRFGEGGKAFGSITSQDIAEALAAQGLEIDHRKVGLSEPIKNIGSFKVPLSIDEGVTANLRVWVVKEE